MTKSVLAFYFEILEVSSFLSIKNVSLIANVYNGLDKLGLESIIKV